MKIKPEISGLIYNLVDIKPEISGLTFLPEVIVLSKIVPMSGDKHNFTNYRAISLLSSF